VGQHVHVAHRDHRHGGDAQALEQAHALDRASRAKEVDGLVDVDLLLHEGPVLGDDGAHLRLEGAHALLGQGRGADPLEEVAVAQRLADDQPALGRDVAHRLQQDDGDGAPVDDGAVAVALGDRADRARRRGWASRATPGGC
jgi:hypothetical protein